MADETKPPPPPEAYLPPHDARPEPIGVSLARLAGEDPLPATLGYLPLRDVVLFPDMVTPVVVARPSSLQVVKRAAVLGTPVLFVAQRNPEVHEPERADLYDIGCVGRLLRALRFSDGSMRLLVEGLRRARVGEFVVSGPAPRIRVSPVEEAGVDTAEADALREQVRKDFRGFVVAGGKAPVELDPVVDSIESASRLADYVAGNLPIDTTDQQAILEELDVRLRLALTRKTLLREKELAELNNQIHANVQTAMDKNQREYYLKEQLRAVKEELGQYDPTVGEIEELRKKLLDAKLPDEVEKESLRELDRMSRMHRDTAEYTVSRTWLDWLLDMPWNALTEDNRDLANVRTVLDEDHSGLTEVKERILEFLAVRELNPESKGPILCFQGPPGVGKTSLGRSIARALGRKFQRIALGGVKDESEIRGHRRTYIGSMPGRIVQAVKRAESRNAVVVLDEIDKVGNDFRGDPASALLEALDPEQNHEFTDHYLDVPFDLSKVMFICTANVTETVPPALLDRMEVIEIPGYIEEEKVAIAKAHLLPKLLKDTGLGGNGIKFTDAALQSIIRNYTSEAGVRGLERELQKVLRKAAKAVVLKNDGPGTVKPGDLVSWLGPQKFFLDMAERLDLPGIAVGLAWTSAGGDILFIEVTQMAGGSGQFKITGQLGNVMKESAETAMSFVRANAVALGIDPTLFKSLDFHVHFPQGAIPKDGPSAGITTIVALVSLLTQKRVNPEIAMTGEITLRGKVLPVGGIKEKVLAARRAGIRHVLIPRQNEKDLLDVPQPLRDEMKVTLLDRVDDALPIAFSEPSPKPARKKSA